MVKYTHKYTHARMHASTHSHTFTHIHTHIHTHTHDYNDPSEAYTARVNKHCLRTTYMHHREWSTVQYTCDVHPIIIHVPTLLHTKGHFLDLPWGAWLVRLLLEEGRPKFNNQLRCDCHDSQGHSAIASPLSVSRSSCKGGKDLLNLSWLPRVII